MKVIYTKKKERILVDDEDYDYLSKMTWHVSSTGYARTRRSRLEHPQKKQTYYFMHRLILGITDPKISIDHKNRNPLDNRRENIRICTQSQNNANYTVLKRNKIGLKGVRYKAKKYEAYIWKNKSIYLGRFNTAEEAAKAYGKAALELFGEFARLNYEKENITKRR